MAVIPVRGLPLIRAGDPLASLLVEALAGTGLELRDGDVIVFAQKIVSKAEGRAVRLGTVTAGAEAEALAARIGKPTALVQLMLDESTQVIRTAANLAIVRHRLGVVAANAGIDSSNVEGDDGDAVLLWPADPDATARSLRAELEDLTGRRLAVVIADSIGRAWRMGTIGTAIGASGMAALHDRRGEPDLFGRPLQATLVATADAVAAAAVLVMGEGAEGIPAVIVRGLDYAQVDGTDDLGAAALLRPLSEDLFQ